MKKHSFAIISFLFVLFFSSEAAIGYQLYPTGEAGVKKPATTSATSKKIIKQKKKSSEDAQQKILNEFTKKNTQKRPDQMPEQDPRDIEPSTQI